MDLWLEQGLVGQELLEPGSWNECTAGPRECSVDRVCGPEFGNGL